MTFKINSQGHTAMHQNREGYILLIILLKGVGISTNNYKEQTVIMTFKIKIKVTVYIDTTMSISAIRNNFDMYSCFWLSF